MSNQLNNITLNLNADTIVCVKGFIAPIEYTQYNFHVRWDELANMQIAEPDKHYTSSVFNAFLPTESVSVGDCWEIDDNVLEILSQLHPNPNLKMHINNGDSLGLWACLRAYNDEYVDIMFRIHAEFKLKGGWFTPSQFTGHLVINLISGNIIYFKMHVPNNILNFDVNWDDIGTDIGYCPQMELCSGILPRDVEYSESITETEAEHALILRFYNSEKINWVSLEEALEIAPAQQKPIHIVSIDGPLTDESC